MIHRTKAAAICLLAVLSLGLSSCASEAQAPSPQEDSTDVENLPGPETDKKDGEAGSNDFSKPGVVLMLESQLAAFGGTGHWDGNNLIVRFEEGLDENEGLSLAFVCDLMNGLVLEEHTTAVETPEGVTECAV